MFIYRAIVLDVHDEAAQCDGVFYTVVDSSFDITIQALNCTNEEFANHFINVYGGGDGQLDDDSIMVMYFNSFDCEIGDEITVSSDDSFNSMLSKRIRDANETLDQTCRRFLSKHKLPPYQSRLEYTAHVQKNVPLEFDVSFDIELD